MAQAGGERFRGTADVPLTEAGIRETQDIARRLAVKGGLDEIRSSSLGRAVQTARIIAAATHAPLTYIGDGLHPWHLGHLEGTPVTPEALAYINDLIVNHPDDPIPGCGPLSTAMGEAFSAFKCRTLRYIQSTLDELRHRPGRRVGMVTHYRVKKLLEAWLAAGGMGEAIDPQVMIRHEVIPPGGVDLLCHGTLTPVDINSPDCTVGGLYIIRHEKTAFNSSQS